MTSRLHEIAAAESFPKAPSPRYVDSRHQPTEVYPLNPNGSLFGITSLVTSDGRVTIIMLLPRLYAPGL